MYHPDAHSHHTRASTIGHQAPPPLPHLPSSSAGYASLASTSTSTQPYPPRQPSPAGYPVELYPTTYQDQQHYQPHQPHQQHFQPPPPLLQLHPQPHPSNSNLTGAYPHHSRYLKIHSFSPSSSSSYNNNPLDLFVNCTLFPTSSNKNSPASLDPSSHPPAKTIRLCFGSLPLATKVARAPGSAPADAGGQDLLLSCRVPKWEDVVSNGKPGVGGGRVGVHCEILGAGMGGGEERVLERVWFGEFQFLGAGEEQEEMGMDVGGWGGGGGGRVRASTHQPLSQKRAGSPLLSHSPQRRHSPGLRTNEMDPYESYQQEFNVVDHHGGGGGQNSPYLQVDLQRPPPGTGSYSYHADPTPQRTYSPSPLIAHHAPPHSSQSYVSPQPGHSSPQQFWSAPPPPSQPPLSTSSRSIPTPIVPPSPNQPLTINPQNLSPTTPPNQPHSSLHPGSESTPLMVRTFQLPRTPKAQRATPTSASGGGPGGVGGVGGGVKSESPGMVTRAVDGRDTHGVQAGVGGKGGTTKASLLLQGDLGQMAIGWNQEEWASRRRLIQFWRRHEKGTIHAAFRPIAQADYIENSIVISCIYREDTNECYVTSVDTIYLLEALIGVRFSVEEKNRIRRNLEGLKPDTVSKNKPSTEEFFKLVMGLPKPKPRNIEKDVKVFKWANFGDALVKIISKYSVAYEEPRGPASPPKVPGPLQPVPSSSINHIQPPHPSPIYQQYPGPPPPLDPHFQQSPYPYGTSPLPDDRQPREFNHAQPLHARYSSQSSSDNPSMEFSQSASSSSSSLHAGSSYVGTRSGASLPAASQPHSSPFAGSAAGRPPLNHHASSTSPASFQTQTQTQSQPPPPPPTNQLLPAFHQPSEAGYDFTDYFNPLSENNTPSSSSAMAVPPYPSSTSTTTSATFASSAVPTPSSSGDFAAIGGGASFHIPTSAGGSSSSSFPALEAFDLDPKQAALAGLPSSVASLALGERGGGAAVASGAGGIPGVVRMEEVLKATTAVEEEGSGDELEEDEEEDGEEDAHGLDL